MAVGREVRATVLVGAVGAEDWEQIKLMAAAQGAVGADGVEIHAALIKVMVGGKPWCLRHRIRPGLRATACRRPPS